MDRLGAAALIVIDTNLLVFAHRSRVPEHDAARQALQQASGDAGGWGIAPPSLLEFWSVVTHPTAAGRPSSPAEARAFVTSLVTAGARILTPKAGLDERLMASAADHDIVGARIFDLQIAMIALEHGADEVWSHDKGFVTLPGLRMVDPLNISETTLSRGRPR